jgi:hypothetical protein
LNRKEGLGGLFQREFGQFAGSGPGPNEFEPNSHNSPAAHKHEANGSNARFLAMPPPTKPGLYFEVSLVLIFWAFIAGGVGSSKMA